jgi:hypothetical protein
MRRALMAPLILLLSLVTGPAALASSDGAPDISGGTGTVVQTGLLNYAGPGCPGPNWNCTGTSGPVIQVSSGGGGANVFVCDPEGTGTNEETNTCVIEQSNTDGTNQAVCIERDEQDEGVVEQSCAITQTNVSGDNIATVRQTVVMDHRETTQRSEQRSSVDQTNGTGDNEADVEQRSDLSAKAHGDASSDISQVQDVIQDSDVQQDTGVGVLITDPAGDNTTDVFQSHVLDAKAHKAASVEQLQNAEEPLGETDCGILQGFQPNICSEVNQLSTNGDQLIGVRQDLRHEARAEPVSEQVIQQQGSSEFTGGMITVNHQDSSGVSRRSKVQIERQNAVAHKKAFVTQDQFTGMGPRANSDQVGNADNLAVADQSVHQHASDPDSQQLQIGAIAFPISGEARFTQQGCQNGECEQQTVTSGPPGVAAELGCDNPPPGEGGDPPPECQESGPIPPDSEG